jgi:hypothetical protein
MPGPPIGCPGGGIPGRPEATPGCPGSLPGCPGATPGRPGPAPGCPGATPGRPGPAPGCPGAIPGCPGTLRPGGTGGTGGTGGPEGVCCAGETGAVACRGAGADREPRPADGLTGPGAGRPSSQPPSRPGAGRPSSRREGGGPVGCAPLGACQPGAGDSPLMGYAPLGACQPGAPLPKGRSPSPGLSSGPGAIRPDLLGRVSPARVPGPIAPRCCLAVRRSSSQPVSSRGISSGSIGSGRPRPKRRPLRAASLRRSASSGPSGPRGVTAVPLRRRRRCRLPWPRPRRGPRSPRRP